MSNTDFDFSDEINAYGQGAVAQGALAPTGSPERTAKVLDLEARSGVPAAIIDLDIEKSAEEIQQQERAATIQNSPRLQTYINSDPNAAKISSDDLTGLDSLFEELVAFSAQPPVSVDWENPIMKSMTEAFDSSTPLGISYGSETDEFFRDIGLFKSPDRADPGTYLTEPVIRGVAAAFDLLFVRAAGAVISGTATGVGELVAKGNELVGSDFFGNPKMAKREVQNFLNYISLGLGHGKPVWMEPRPSRSGKFQEQRPFDETRFDTSGKTEEQIIGDYQLTKAEFDAAEFDAAYNAALETKTRERAPQFIRMAVEQQVGDRSIGINAEALREAYKTRGVMPAPGDPVMGWVPDIGARLERALASGTDVEVPYASYLAFADPAIHKELIPGIRSKSGMTIVEVEDAIKEMDEAMASRESKAPAPKALVSGEGPLLDATVTDLPGVALPPAPEGTTRVYHSGNEYTGGPRWVSTSPTYVNYRGGAMAFYADIPTEALKAIKGAYDDVNNFFRNVELPEELAGYLKPITEEHVIRKAETAPDSMAPSPDQGAIQPGIPVRHVSPHLFEEFSLEKIGTGEGSQSFSHGLYFTESPSVVDFYDKTLRVDDSVSYNGTVISELPVYQRQAAFRAGRMPGRLIELISVYKRELDEALRIMKPDSEYVKLKQQQYDFAVQIQKDPTGIKADKVGAIYDVLIEADPQTFIQWDQSINSQPPPVLAAIKSLIGDIDPGLTGKQFYTKLQKQYPNKTPAELSQMLMDAGVSGVKYLDGFSRKKGEGTYNYVVYDPKWLRITSRNGVEMQVRQAKKDLYLEPMASKNEVFLDQFFNEPKAAGMTSPEYKLYSRKTAEQFDAARQADAEFIQRRTMRELTAEWRTTLAREIEKAGEEFDARLDVQAAAFMREQGFKISDTGGVKLPKDLIAADGMSADDLAGFLGYATGEELVADLGRLTAEQGRRTAENFRKAVVKEVATGRTEESFGDMADRAEAVLDQVMSPETSQVLYDDLRVMQKQGGGNPLELAELVEWAKVNFRKLPVKEARRSKNYIRALIQSGRKAEMALLKGDIIEAFKYKNQQLVNLLFLQQAHAFEKSLKGAMKLVKPYTKRNPPKAVFHEFTDQIHGVLEQIGIPVNRTTREIPPLAEFVAGWNEFGYDLAVSDSLFNGTPLGAVNELAVEMFEEVVASIKSLDHVGRDIKKIDRAGHKADLAATVEAIEQQVATLPMRFKRTKGAAEATKHRIYDIDSQLVKMEQVFDDLDLQDPQGPFNGTVFRPLAAAEHAEDALFKRTQEFLGEAHKKLMEPKKKIVNDFINPMTGKPHELVKADVVMMALNFGNKHNRDLLVNTLVKLDDNLPTDVRVFDMARNEQKVLAFINKHMTEGDWAYVNTLWDYFAWLKPQIDDLYLRTAGVAPDTVQGLPFETPFGTQKGGYAPVIQNPLEAKVELVKEKQSFEANYFKATTPNSYTKKRKANFEPMLVETQYEILPYKIRQMLHDLAFREAIINAQKVLLNKKVATAINKHYGPEYRNTMTPWLRYLANHYNVEDRELKTIAKILRSARQNLVVAVLGANLKTILTPNIGPVINELAMSPSRVNYMMMHWNRYKGEAWEKSGEIRSRMQNMDRDVGSSLNRVIGLESKWERARAQAAQAGMYLTAEIDTRLSVIVWHQYYARALARGLNEADAVYEGDKAVRTQMGSASHVNMAPLLRSSEGMKLLTLFYGYMNTVYNRERDIVQTTASGFRRVKRGDNAGAKRDFAKVFGQSMAHIIIPGLFGVVYNPDIVEESETWGGAIAKLGLGQIAGTIPFVRDIAAAMIQDVPQRTTPAGTILWNTVAPISELWDVFYKGEDWSDTWLKKAIAAPGYALGLPTGQLANTSQYLWNLTTNEDSADNFGEFMRGIIYGKSGSQ